MRRKTGEAHANPNHCWWHATQLLFPFSRSPQRQRLNAGTFLPGIRSLSIPKLKTMGKILLHSVSLVVPGCLAQWCFGLGVEHVLSSLYPTPVRLLSPSIHPPVHSLVKWASRRWYYQPSQLVSVYRRPPGTTHLANGGGGGGEIPISLVQGVMCT